MSLNITKATNSSSSPVRLWNKSGTEELVPAAIQLSSLDGVSEIILDYGRAVGGISFFETANVQSEDATLTLEVTYSETRAGIEKEKGNLTSNTSQTNIQLISSRRWTIPVVFQCNGHLQSQYTLFQTLSRFPIHRIKVRSKVATISETGSQIIKLLDYIFLDRVSASETTSYTKKLFQMFE